MLSHLRLKHLVEDLLHQHVDSGVAKQNLFEFLCAKGYIQIGHRVKLGLVLLQ
jgi:hypothetical protein